VGLLWVAGCLNYHRGSTRSLATGISISGVYAGMALGGLLLAAVRPTRNE